MANLDPLLADGVIDEVLGRLKSGKEADIYLVRRGSTIVAAKLYKDRDRRSFKDNADYKEGRDVRNSRTRRAIESGSTFGREAEEQAWKTAEADALNLLHASEVRVPRPILFTEGVLLMEVVLGPDGQPAPRLIDVATLVPNAAMMYRDLRTQLIRMLCAEIIHGDLSAYNILAAAAGPTIIDFPQVVSPSHNSRAEYFFLRDFQNVWQFLLGHDRSLQAFRDDGVKIWRAYVRRSLTPDFVPPQGPVQGHRPPQHGRPPQPHPRPPQNPNPRPPHPNPNPRPPQHPNQHPPHAPGAQPGQAPNPHGRRRRRRGRGRGGPGPQPNANAPASPNAPRPAPSQPPRPPKLPGWLQRAAKRGGAPRPQGGHPDSKKPFRRRKRRFS